MDSRKWTFIIIIIQSTISHSTAYISNNGKPYKLVTRLSIEKENKLNADEYMLSTVGKCKHKCTISYLPHSRYNGNRRSFTDLGTNASGNSSEMEPPAAKFSFLNLLTGEEAEDDDSNDEYGSGDSLKEEYEINDEGNDNDDDGIDFFGYDDEEDEDGGEIKDEDGLLKQYKRHRLRMHNLVFPLLLAYKLKFFTVIPLLLGSLVLLVGTTGIAGFFFALFAAALGIHVKSHQEH